MKVKAPNRKIERKVIVSTICGVFLVAIVWGFQIHSIFTDGLAREVSETKQESVETIAELEEFRVQVEKQMPMITTTLGQLTEVITSQIEQDQALFEAEQELESQAVETVVQEALERLQTENSQEDEEPIE